MMSILIDCEMDEFCDNFGLYDSVGDGKVELFSVG